MRIKNEATSSGYTEILIAGIKEKLHVKGIHRIKPTSADIEDAIQVAERDGFDRIYLHTTKPLNMLAKLRSIKGVLSSTTAKKKPNLRPYNWNTNNTKFSEWFERDRASVRLTDMFDREIICLWDEAVAEFVEDGFKTSRQSWHEALVEYATEHKLTSKVDND